mmetsp:Transcript_11117/g.34080  ORF Transcript_11117/g.34080 Transcript_11117/m.34080 type:complete len:338 (-) Transcript_11117:1357-2370(-)|eukprot:CAMPEP_0198729984 /NCGR_PEP_ID=MMETSP1475-20131203/22150_1 /TAXON_ID= ORGANISM="Unidentified sp., Strain CCMP1999" /NCGR_SAMPLE_ID=MMETSP1475 /ASSEMBLY_ACC=CAM_ASM_001111 /LENGTH=337 /DNA_ID=CAMNT_0044492721 /DNA_START=132 /DNA_END=1145 /DNA_ORIENTATION=+
MKVGEDEQRPSMHTTDGGSNSRDPLDLALSDKEHDPLNHEEWDTFWKEVESYFRPIRKSDVTFLRRLDAEASALDEHDPALRIPPLDSAKKNGMEDGNESEIQKDKKEDLHQRLNSYPYTHRLVAALIDERDPKTVTAPSSTKAKSTQLEEVPWLGPGDEDPLRTYQKALEERITTELKTLGLIDEEAEDELQADIRQAQWILRDLKLVNCARRKTLLAKSRKYLSKEQSLKRQMKKEYDDAEIRYLVHMIRKCKKNKRLKSRYQKTLNTLFPNHREQKRDTEDGKDEEPVVTSHKSVKKKSYNKRPSHSSKAAAKKKEIKSDDDIMKDVDDDSSPC